MSDDFDALRAALKAAPPPDAADKAAALALAMENFDRMQAARQGSPGDARLEEDRQVKAGFLNGVRKMLKDLSSRPILTATTSVAALCVGVFVLLPMGQKPLPVPSDLGQVAEQRAKTEAPALKVAPVQPKPLADAAPAEADMQVAPAQDMAQDAVVADLASRVDAAAGNVAAAPEMAEPVMPEATMSAPEMSVAAPMPAAPPAAAAKQGAGMATRQAMTRGYSVAPGDMPMDMVAPLPDTEAFSTAPLNPVHVTAEEPVSTFSADVDTASYGVIRSSLNAGQLPPPEAVRVEEMVNYFPYDLPRPEGDQAFRSSISVMPTPWNPQTRLVAVALQGRSVTERPPLDLVFLIDTSGSMDEPAKLPLLRQSLALMLPKLNPQDKVAIVTYAGSAGEVLAPTPASDRKAILAALDNLGAGGSTAGAEGLALAYQVADEMKAEGRVSRILLATDGDFNVGIDDPEALKTFVAVKREGGTYLSVLGFGRGNLDDATMQALAQNGNGTASYIDTLSEAQKVLGDQLQGAMFPIADDVKIQVEWNPAEVAEYRLIGYETRALRREDFNNDKIDAGEIGAGLQVTALYEVTAPGSAALRNTPLRYEAAPEVPGEKGELGFLRLRYKAPGQDASQLIEAPISADLAATSEARFAAAVAGFGQLLEGAPYLGDWGYDQAIALATEAKGPDAYGYRAEAVTLMRLAQSLSR